MTPSAVELPGGFLDRPFTHRALHGPGRPENSREAIAAAVAASYGIEIDVQLSRDAQAMVFHDYGLQRLMGINGTVQTKKQQQLAATPLLGGRTGPPTLPETLRMIDGRVPLVIEVKDQDGAMGPNVGVLEEQVAAALTAYAGPVAVMSFNPHSVAALADLAPNVPRGITTCDFNAEDWPTVPATRRAELAPIPDFDRVGASFISHDRKTLTDPAVAALKSRGIPVLTWTVKSQEQANVARQIADQITFEGFTPA
ncbi:MAG: glycerophosphodiester phosphodiesterase family protein [Pseudomonadota bacterium]